MSVSVPPFETIAGWIKGLIPISKRIWMTLNGPAIGIKLRGFLGDNYVMEVRNVRGGVVIARVFIQDITDNNDKLIGKTIPVEVFESKLEPTRLFGNSMAVFNVFTVSREVSCQRLGVWTRLSPDGKKPPGRWFEYLCDRIPLNQQHEMRMTIRVVFYFVDSPTVEVEDQVHRISVVPLPDSGHYSARLIKHRH